LLCTLEDVTAAEAETALEATEKRFRSLVETMNEGLCAIGRDGIIRYANPRLQQMVGRPEQDVVGDSFLDLFDGPSRARLAEIFSAESREKLSFEATLPRDGGRAAYVQLSTAPVLEDDGTVVGCQALITDISARRLAESQLSRVKQQLERILESSPTIICSSKRSQPFAFTFIGANVFRLLGYHASELIQEPSTFIRRIHPEDREAMLADVLAWNGQSPLSMVYRVRHHDGAVRWVQESRHLSKDEVSGEEMIIGSLQDVTSLRQTQESLNQQEALFRAVVEHTNDVVTLMQFDGTVLFKSPSYRTVLGRDPEAAVGRNAFDIIHPDDIAFVKQTVEKLLETPEESATIDIRVVHGDGSIRPFETVLKILPKRAGLSAVLATCRDVTARKKAEEQRGRLEAKLTHQAYHDALTGLPNRKLFMERLSGVLRRGRDESSSFAVLYLDIDRFKQVNDSVGHVEADHVLQAFVARVLGAMREGDLLARLGGDEFGIVMGAFHDRADVLALARRIESRTERPIVVPGGGEVVCTASIGIVFGDEEGIDSIPEIVTRADAAMYHAKANGRARFAVFDSRMVEERASHLEIRTGLTRAIERNELYLEYQPCISLTTGKVTSCEALLRWRFGDVGLVPPDRFIRVAEEAGMIDRLAVWCLQSVCAQIRSWTEDGLDVPCVSVNLSPHNLNNPRFLDQISEILGEHAVGPHQIEFEITESALFGPGQADPALIADALRRTGVSITVDDFGKGYSSLSYLRTLPAQAVKIDRSLVAEVTVDDRSAAIVRAIVGLAEPFGFRVIGGGVETDEQLSILRREGCDEAQGFLFCRPCEPQQLAEFLEQWSAPWNPAQPG
jgi:diguanylate cyclase (GGDEF)-like protein/PAS domain S-box-containing protein